MIRNLEDNLSHTKTAEGFLYGLRTGTPIAIGYIPGALACGILCKTAGLTLWESCFMSAVVFAGASQFVALNLLSLGAAFPEIVLAAAVLNARHVLMTSSLARKFTPEIKTWEKVLVCSQITDESFSVASMLKEDRLSPRFMFGLNIVGYSMWVIGTVFGHIGAAVLPKSVQESMGIAIYALFVGLLLPSIRKSKPGLLVAVAAMGASALIKWTPFFASLNRGLAIMLATGAAALLGAVIYPKGDETK